MPVLKPVNAFIRAGRSVRTFLLLFGNYHWGGLLHRRQVSGLGIF